MPETVRLLPSDAWSDYLRRDYEQMQVLFFGQSPAFDKVMSDLADLEQAIRQM